MGQMDRLALLAQRGQLAHLVATEVTVVLAQLAQQVQQVLKVTLERQAQVMMLLGLMVYFIIMAHTLTMQDTQQALGTYTHQARLVGQVMQLVTQTIIDQVELGV